VQASFETQWGPTAFLVEERWTHPTENLDGQVKRDPGCFHVGMSAGATNEKENSYPTI